MKPLKTFAIIPILAIIGFTAAKVAVPPAYGDDAVKIRASILFTIDSVTLGYVSYREPVFERIVKRVVEPQVVYVYREPPRPVYVHEHALPVVIVKNERRDCDRPGWGNKYGHYTQVRKAIVIHRNDRGNERDIHGNGRPARDEVRDNLSDDRNTRGYAKQLVESRKGKYGKNE